MTRRLVLFAMLTVGSTARAAPFEYLPPGDLAPGSGEGLADDTVYAPDMRFPLESGPAYPNSQVWGHGGSEGPGGSQCDIENYSYPWRDNYCETRTWDMPLCPAGQGHQGQDIRAATCDDAVHWTVAADAGEITNIGSYSIYLTAADGTRFDYLHSTDIQVGVGAQVAEGDRISKVSNEFGGTPTTLHLHFNIRQDVAGVGVVYVPPYMSLVAAYEELMGLSGGEAEGSVDATDCTAISGWAWNPAAPDVAATVRVYFDGAPGDPAAIAVELVADQPRDDLCDTLGSCDHAFSLEVPVHLRDNAEHPAHVIVVGDAGAELEVEASPTVFTCAPPPLPDGVRRWIRGPEAFAAWGFSELWQVAVVDDATLESLPTGPDFTDAPLLVRREGDDASGPVWLVDPEVRRPIPDAIVASAWGLDLATAQVWSDAELDALPEGTPLRPEPFVVQGIDAVVYVVDDVQCAAPDAPVDCDAGEDGTGGTSGAGTAGGDGDGAWTEPALPDGFGEHEGGGGCACRSEPGHGLPMFGLLVFAALRRRRPAAVSRP